MTFRVAHWDIMVDDNLMFLSALMALRVVCLHFTMQEGGILEHTNGKCHLCTL